MIAKRAAGAEVDAPDSEGEPLERRLTEYAKVGLPLGTVGLALLAGLLLGPPSAVLVLAGGALIGVIATLWASVRTLLGETPLAGADAYALGAPRAEEEQKRAVLRALKDLEFERSVGKISDDDYQVLVTKYRTEAKRLLKLLDSESQPRREQAEALVAKRLKREGLGDGAAAEKKPEAAAAEKKPEAAAAEEASEATADEAPEAATADEAATTEEEEQEGDDEDERAAEKAKVAARSAPSTNKPLRTHKGRVAEVVCAGCGASNDEDAVFCKKCGKRCSQEPAARAEEEET